MTVVTGQVQDIGMAPLSGALIATSVEFRTSGDFVVAPESRSWPIVNGDVSVDLLPGPTRITIQVGSHARDSFDVIVPEEPVTLAALVEDAFPWSPSVVSAVAAHRLAAERAVLDAEGWATSFGLSATASTLAPGSPATVTVTGDGPAYSVAFGVPQGDKGAKGDPGEVSAAQLASGLAGKADLVGGQVPTSQIPAVALSKPFPVADRAAMLALTVEEGDVAVVTAGADKGTYMLSAGPSTVFSSWVKLTTPDAPVQSVNGQTGTVNLNAANVGASPSGHTHPVSDLTTTGTASSSTFLRGDGSWATPPNTTYSVPTQAEAEAGTATTGRAFSAQRVRQAIDARAVARSGTAVTLWSGTQAQYDALAPATKNAAGFVAVIS